MFSVTVIAPPLVTLAYNEAGTNIVDGLGRREAARGIVMDNADSSLNLRTFVPSPRDLGQAAAR